jgi:serine phosphatase RsbU (regulator of sigma subunit)
MLPCRVPLVTGLLSLSVLFAVVPVHAAAPPSAPVLRIDGLGKGTAPLDGPWQFHIGDDPAWALPETTDASNQSGWEQLSPEKTWGQQGHADYTGFAWYRKHIHLSIAPGVPPNLNLLIYRIDDVYEIYWNGRLVGRHGTMPPDPSFPSLPPPQLFGIGDVRDGVLAFRVWKAPLVSFDTGLGGGFAAAPVIGQPEAINALKTQNDYTWLRSRQYFFGINSLYGLVALLSLLAWFRNPSQRVLVWIALFTAAPIINMFLEDLRLSINFTTGLGWLQPVFSLQDIALWFLLIYLLKLDKNPKLARFTRALAILSIISTSLDGLLCLFWFSSLSGAWIQWADAVLTAIFTTVEAYPLLLVAMGVRKRLDSSRWILAISAFLTEMLFVGGIALRQGSRFTHWTIGGRLQNPLFSFNGNGFPPQTLANTLLLLAIINAVYHYMRETSRRQGALEQEMKSARELQRVLIPEALPELPGFAVSSSYRPAQEVGGDFFQIIPLDGEFSGSTLILVGDVSGKGLRAAMTVSLIVGTVRTLAKFVPAPAEFLSELNQRLYGRLQGGFTTCLAMRLDGYGRCTIASAGHPAPLLNQREIELPGALPLGIMLGQLYPERQLQLEEGDHIALYTDGLIEARNVHGELFSFDRLHTLFASRTCAADACEAAVSFGQDDDITVLTLTRLGTGQRPSTEFSTPTLASA